jgi:hypothetical protein
MTSAGFATLSDGDLRKKTSACRRESFSMVACLITFLCWDRNKDVAYSRDLPTI